jgi:hypothetical protein
MAWSCQWCTLECGRCLPYPVHIIMCTLGGTAVHIRMRPLSSIPGVYYNARPRWQPFRAPFLTPAAWQHVFQFTLIYTHIAFGSAIQILRSGSVLGSATDPLPRKFSYLLCSCICLSYSPCSPIKKLFKTIVCVRSWKK